jgi:hypothetical protein
VHDLLACLKIGEPMNTFVGQVSGSMYVCMFVCVYVGYVGLYECVYVCMYEACPESKDT